MKAVRSLNRRWPLVALGTVGLGMLLARRIRRTDLSGRVVVITGGSRGLGLAMAREFGAAGCRIAICSRDPVQLESARRDLAQRGLKVLARPCDVSLPDAVERWVTEIEHALGPIDVVVNNAGIIQVGPVEAMAREDFERAMNTNFWGPFNVTMSVLPWMRRRGRGTIVNITSIGGKVSIPHLMPYSCSKFALMAFSEGLTQELSGGPIRVVTVVPGLVRTGSPENACFHGEAELEYAWFSLGSATPLTAVGIRRAARRIVRSVRRGETEVTLNLLTRVARVAHGLAPRITVGFLGWMSRMLPEAAERGEPTRGMHLATRVSPSPLTAMMNRAAREYNQFGGLHRPSPAHARKAGLPEPVPAYSASEAM